jgi:hypothetical protein
MLYSHLLLRVISGKGGVFSALNLFYSRKKVKLEFHFKAAEEKK